MSKPPIGADLDHRRWIRWDKLTPAERSVLKGANTLDDPKPAVLDAYQPTPKLTPHQVLNESEIRDWMERHRANPEHPGYKIFKKKAPALYAEFQYEAQLKTVTEADFAEAKDAALDLIDFFLSEVSRRDEGYPAPNILPLSYASLSPGFLKRLGENAGFAFGMIHRAWTIEVGPRYANRISSVGDYRDALFSLREKIEETQTFPRFLLNPPRDPLRFPDGIHPAATSKTEQHAVARHEKGREFIEKLVRYLDIVAVQQSKPGHEANKLLDEDLVIRGELLKFATHHFGSEAHSAVRALFQATSRYYGNTSSKRETQRAIDQAGLALSRLMGRHGYYAHLITIGSNDRERLHLLYGDVLYIEQYQVLKRDRASTAPAEVYYVRNLNIANQPAPLYFPAGMTLSFVGDRPFSVVNLDFQANQHQFLNRRKRSWVSEHWQQSTQGWKWERILKVMNQGVAFHELNHHWRRVSGQDSSYLGFEEQSVEESSSAYASVAFSEDPSTMLLYLLLTLTCESPGDGDSADLEFDFRDPHSKGMMEFLIDLATQYEMKIPEGTERLKTEWIRELIEKIDSTTPNRAANEAILRTKVAQAYGKRFGIPLIPMQKARPRTNIEFIDKSVE